MTSLRSCAFWAVVLGSIFAHADLSPNAILEDELARFQHRPPSRIVFKSEYSLAAGKENDLATKGEFRTGEIRYDGSRLELVYFDDFWDQDNQEFVLARDGNQVWHDGRALGVRNFRSLGREPHSQYYTTKSMLHDSVRPDMNGWFADGVLVGSSHYAEQLLKADNISITAEKFNERELFRIEGDTSDGHLTVWLDSISPNLLRKASFVANNSFVAAETDLAGVALDIEVTGYAIIGNTPIATQASAVYSYRLAGQSELIKKVVRVERNSVEIEPDFSQLRAFEFEIPENEEVRDYDFDDTLYIWRGKKLIPVISVDTEAAIAGLLSSLAESNYVLADAHDRDKHPSQSVEQKGHFTILRLASGVGFVGCSLLIITFLFRRYTRRKVHI